MDEQTVNKKLWLADGWEFKMYPSRAWAEDLMVHWYTVKDRYFVKESGDDEFGRFLVFRKAVA